MSIYKKLYIFTYMSINLGRINITSARIGRDTIIATGGTTSTITVAGRQYRVHTFTTTGTSSFVTNDVCGEGMTDCLVVAGGGSSIVGGGGGGGLIYQQYKVYPNVSYTVIVGAGGVGVAATSYNATVGNNGQNSKFDTLTAIGGGAGGWSHMYGYGYASGNSGGSGGGGGAGFSSGGAPTANQGNVGSGGQSGTYGGGGGGAGQAGQGSNGGNGRQIDITGTATYYAGGGGGGGSPNGANGLGGGATANTGGGGIGNYFADRDGGSAGGSGIVIIRYPLPRTV